MRLFSIIVTFLITSVLAKHHTQDGPQPELINLQGIVNEVNSDPTSTWKADTYGAFEIDLKVIKKSLGAKLRGNATLSKNSSKSKFLSKDQQKLGGAFPRTYDARQRYPKCKSISHIRDQSYCGSCWAVSAASVLSDRLCIRSRGRYNHELSSRFITACDKQNYGCDGGYLDVAWEFLEKTGTVSGGEFESDEGCQPYNMHPCGWPRKLACPWYLTPKCLKFKCDNEFYRLLQEKYPTKARTSYQVGDSFGLFSEYYMKDEIYHNGPVQAAFDVYADFLTYKSGIYHHKKHQRFLGGHAVKIMGWGEERGVKYWLIANSWGEEWGENGTFRMIRGMNDCGIESEVYAGIPKL